MRRSGAQEHKFRRVAVGSSSFHLLECFLRYNIAKVVQYRSRCDWNMPVMCVCILLKDQASAVFPHREMWDGGVRRKLSELKTEGRERAEIKSGAFCQRSEQQSKGNVSSGSKSKPLAEKPENTCKDTSVAFRDLAFSAGGRGKNQLNTLGSSPRRWAFWPVNQSRFDLSRMDVLLSFHLLFPASV